MSIAVVTGASGGIGAEIAKRLAQDGFSVALIYNRNAEKAQKTADEIILSGGSAKTYKCDVRDSSEITSAIEAIERDFGQIKRSYIV
jgi:3-oxoacyl-[acyl-carrier protein] reductase